MNSTHFDKEAGDGIIDDAGGDALFGFEGALVAVELVAMETCIMIAFGIENEAIIAGARLVVDHNVGIGGFPNEVDIATNYMSI